MYRCSPVNYVALNDSDQMTSLGAFSTDYITSHHATVAHCYVFYRDIRIFISHDRSSATFESLCHYKIAARTCYQS